MKKDNKLESKKTCQSEFPYMRSVIIGIIIATASMHNNIPIKYKTDLKSLILNIIY